MAKWTIGSYNRFIGAARRARPGLTLKEARTTYRRFKEALGHPVFQTDIRKHPKIFRGEAKIAQLQRAEEVLREREETGAKEIETDAEDFFESDMPEPEPREEDEWEVGGKADYAEEE